MKIHTSHQHLQQALELISRVSMKHITLPVLQCTLFEVMHNKITLKATNLEINIEVDLVGTIATDGTIAVPTQTLLQSIQYSTAAELVLEKDGDVLVVRNGKSVTKINLHPSDEFPQLQKIEQTGVVVSGVQFAQGIKTVAIAASLTSIKPELGSVYIQQKREHSLTFVATDSFRLMEKTVPQKNVVLEQSIMVPQKNALELARVIEVLKEDPIMMVNETQCALQFTSGIYISSRLITGTFPDYQQIIPKEFSTHTTVVKQDLSIILKKTQVFLNKFMQVTVAATQRALTLSAHNGEVGAVSDEMSADTAGEDITLNFNHRYLFEPLQYINDDTIVLHFA